jgi:hypothetical protein
MVHLFNRTSWKQLILVLALAMSLAGRSPALAQCSLVVTNTDDGGAGSLRDAINCANNMAGPVQITFNIPGAGVHVIQPYSVLPDITTTVTIDGYSQPGAVPNTLVHGDNAVIRIQIDGSQIGYGASVVRERASRKAGSTLARKGRAPTSAQQFDDGLFIDASDCVIRGLSIVNFSGYGIEAYDDNATIQGCFIGVAPDGLTAGPNFAGVAAYYGTQVGGTSPAARNILSGNYDVGVEVDSDDSVIQGNYVGTDLTGLGSLGNGDDGIQVFGWFTQVGGTSAGTGNVIAFNDGAGVNVFCGLGVTVTQERTRKLTGECAGGCVIGASILGNSIFSNSWVGISLGESPTPNDDCDEDSGPNGLQNYPVLTRAEVRANGTLIEGTLNSAPGGTYRIEFFANPSCDESGFGEGRTFLGSTSVETGDGCDASISVTVPAILTAGQVVTATATDLCGDTSEFSACQPVINGICLKSPPPPNVIISSPILPLGAIATLIWSPPFPGFGGKYAVLISKDNGLSYEPFAGGLTGNTYSFYVTFEVGATVLFEVVADPGCGPNGVSDPSRPVSLQVVQECPPIGQPAAQVDESQVAVGDPWSLHWTPTLPSGLGGPEGNYEVWISEDYGVSYHTAGTTQQSAFTGPPVPQSDFGKIVFLQVIAKPSCTTGNLSAGFSNVVFFTVLPGCEAPQAASNALIQAASPDGTPINRPPYPTEPLSLSWDAPTSGTPPTGYMIRVNGDPADFVSGGTAVIAPARGDGNPVTLYVTTVACDPQSSGPTVQSPTVALLTAPPGASFTISPNPQVGQPVTFTDTSSPEATSWLWLFDDGSQAQTQSPSKTFTTPGTHTAALIATNGAGSGTAVQSFFVNAAASTVTVSSETSGFAVSEPGRRRASVNLSSAGAVWLRLASQAPEDVTLFLRFLDENGNRVIERRLVVAKGETVMHDLGAYGLRGSFDLELVGDPAVVATIVRTGRSTGEVRR